MIPDTTLETVLNLWKEGKVTIGQVRKLLQMEDGIQWRQPQDFQPLDFTPPFIPWIQPNPIKYPDGTWIISSTGGTTHTIFNKDIPYTLT